MINKCNLDWENLFNKKIPIKQETSKNTQLVSGKGRKEQTGNEDHRSEKEQVSKNNLNNVEKNVKVLENELNITDEVEQEEEKSLTNVKKKSRIGKFLADIWGKFINAMKLKEDDEEYEEIDIYKLNKIAQKQLKRASQQGRRARASTMIDKSTLSQFDKLNSELIHVYGYTQEEIDEIREKKVAKYKRLQFIQETRKGVTIQDKYNNNAPSNVVAKRIYRPESEYLSDRVK